MNIHKCLICAAAILLCLPTAASLTSCGKESDSRQEAAALDPEICGTITGTVQRRKTGERISFAHITAEEVNTEQKYESRADEKGDFSIMVPEGTYSLVISKDGYYGLSTDEYTVTKGADCTVTEQLALIAVGESLKETEEESTAPIEPAPVADYHAAYEAYLAELQARQEYRGLDGSAVTGYANMLDYVYYDMDRDGTDEMIVNTGSCEADRSICFYTFKNNAVMLIGSNFSGFHVYGYYRDEETRMLVTQWAHMGNGGATWYQYNGETVSVVNEVGPIAYEEGDNIQFAENLTPLDYHVGVLLDSGWSFT